MEPIFIAIWCQFAPGKDGKWTVRAYCERPDWQLPNAKYYLVKIPVPNELIGGEIVAEVSNESE
jgi:hypothetical protein